MNAKELEMCHEAKSCDGCINWHKHCKAECCKMVELKIDPNSLGSHGEYVTIKVKEPFDPSDQWYYRLHDVHYTRGRLKFRKDRISVIGRRVIYFYICNLLDDGNLCKGHPGNKPKVCRALTSEDSAAGKFFLTDNCLFKYKVKGGSNNGE